VSGAHDAGEVVVEEFLRSQLRRKVVEDAHGEVDVGSQRAVVVPAA
jgi:hypothetical protein